MTMSGLSVSIMDRLSAIPGNCFCLGMVAASYHMPGLVPSCPVSNALIGRWAELAVGSQVLGWPGKVSPGTL